MSWIKSMAVVVAALFLSQQQQETSAAFTASGSRLNPSGLLNVDDVQFGADVAVSGDGTTLIVGAPAYDGESGACAIYVRQGTEWQVQQNPLVGSDVDASTKFGTSVAISENGRVAAVGGPEYDTNGAVWIFRRNNDGDWLEDTILFENRSESAIIPAATNFGISVELSNDGNTVAVGTDDGVVVYFFEEDEWRIQTSLFGDLRLKSASPDNSDPPAPYTQGQKMTLSRGGDYLAFSSTDYVHKPSEEADETAGAIWTWSRSNGLWEETGMLTTSSVADAELTTIGSALALSENGILLVAKAEDASTTKLVEFYLNEASLSYDAGEVTVPSTTFSQDVGTALATARSGQLYFAGDSQQEDGKVFAFGIGGTQAQEIVASGLDATSDFGMVVSSSNDGRVLVVASPNQSSKGAVWTFTGPGTSAPTSSPTIFQESPPSPGPSGAGATIWLSYGVALVVGLAGALATMD